MTADLATPVRPPEPDDKPGEPAATDTDSDPDPERTVLAPEFGPSSASASEFGDPGGIFLG